MFGERELDEELEDDLPEGDESADDESETLDDGETPEAAADDADDEGELVVTIGDEKPEEEEAEVAKAPQWVKDLRKENRELKKQLKAGGGNVASTARKQLGPKPKLADSDYDEAKHEAALDEWYEAKRDADKAERDAADAATAQQREWDSRLEAHTKAKGALKVRDYDTAEETVFEALDQTQQGILVGGADNSALVVYALAKNPKQLKALAGIKDPVKYAFAIAKLETKLKTTKRRPATAPEGTVARSNTGAARTSNATLEKLRAQAEKTGDYTRVNEYRRKLRAAK
jgi:hypothetical protein